MSQEPQLSRLAYASIAVALAVMGIKYVAFHVTGSVALYSDAVESILNVITALLALAAVKIASRPADRRHPFGHHKAEYFSAGLTGAIIVAAALLILQQAYHAWASPRRIEAPALGLAINGLATLINAAWAFVLISRGRRLRSPALEADGWHLMTDVWTSLGVFTGLALAVGTGQFWLDPVLAAGVALNILWAGWHITKRSVGALMDESVTGDILASIRRTIKTSAGGALQVHDLRARTAGRVTFIEFHLVVPGAMTVTEAHAICDRLEQALAAEIEGAVVLIHVEPEGEAKSKGALLIGSADAR